MEKEKTKGRPDGILQHCLDHSTVPVWSVKVAMPDGRMAEAWCDKDGAFVCAKGHERPYWELMSVNRSAGSVLPIGFLSR